jgi:hypothetical protein
MVLGAGAALFAQSEGPARGSIAGKLTDLHSAPVEGAEIVARNESTGAEAHATTQRNGGFSFAGLDAGMYTLEAESERLGRGRLEGVSVSAGQLVHLQTAMDFKPAPPAPIRVVLRDIIPSTPVVEAPLAAEPLQQMLLGGRRLPALPLEMPPTTAPVVTAALVAENLLALPLAGQPVPEAKPSIAPSPVAVEETAVNNTQPARQLAAPPAVKTVQAMPKAGARITAQSADPASPVVTTTMSGAELQALPASGRRWQDFVLDTPTAATASGGVQQTSLRGAGQQPAETTVDGAGTRLAFGGQSGSRPDGQGGVEQSGMGRAWRGGRGAAVAEAAIREVQTAAGNVEAAGSRAAGGRMNVETQRGANGLHGQGFLFDRQNTWGARNPFAQWVKETAPATLTYNPSGPPLSTPVFTPESFTPPDHETVWGVGLGGQIRRDRLFWFAALDSYHRNDPGLSMVKHPYLCANPPQCTEQTGFFAPPSDDKLQMLSARLGLSSANPVVEGLKAYSTMLETLAGLLGPAPRTAAQWVGFGRLDWKAAERHSFTLEGLSARWNSPGGGLTRVLETYGTNSFGSSQAGEEWLLGRWETFLTPNLLAVTQGSLGRNHLSAHAEAPSVFEQTFLGPNVYGQLPQIVVDNRYGFTIGNPSRFGPGSYPDERLYQVQERLDWVRGSLLVKAGFDLSHNYDATSLLRNQTGTYHYSNVENFASDALVFGAFGLSGELNAVNQHGCDETGRVWRDSGGNLRGLGALPCYSYYSQVMGPNAWHLSTNDWAGFVSAQWQPNKLAVFSAGLRWEMEQLPPPIAALANPDLPLTQKLPGLGNDWGPRVGLAVGDPATHWPVLRLGYGMYFGRTENAMLETALTQTGSLKGDMSFFLRPTDDLTNNGGGAPPFPYVLAGEPGSMVKPGAVEFASNFRNPEVHQAVAAVEETLPAHVEVTASAMVSLGRRLPVPIDTNIDIALAGAITYAVVDGTGLGPIKSQQITVPFYASWPSTTEPSGDCSPLTPSIGWRNPCYQQINQITSKANSTYEAAVLKVVRYSRRGLSLHAHYTYAHAMDWNPNQSPLDPDPANFSQEYGTSDLDMRSSAAAMVVYQAPWKLHNLAGKLGNGWMVSGIAQFRSGLPYTMRVSGSLPGCAVTTGITPCAPPPNRGVHATQGDYIVGLRPSMNGSGGDNRVYGMGNDNQLYNIGRNTYRYPATWKADLRLGKSFDLGEMRKLELLVESFNLFNHQNVTELETTGYYIESGSTSSLPTLNFLNGPVAGVNGKIQKANTTAFGQPLNINATNFYRERQIQVGLRMRF